MNRILHLFLTCLCILAFTPAAYATDNDQPPVLHKGINLSCWLANARRQPLFMRDFVHINALGLSR